MKFLLITMVLGLSLYGNEMDRIESIVKDIENLREDYAVCKEELDAQKSYIKNSLEIDLKEKDRIIKELKTLLNKKKEQNNLLAAKLKELNTAKSKDIKNNEKSNNNSTIPLLNKEKENKILISEYEKKIKTKDEAIKSLENKINTENLNKDVQQKICEDDNPFPKLVMKQQVIESVEKVEKQEEKNVEPETEESFKASTFRLNSESDIYDSINGKVIDRWENKTSFTSSVMTENWIKITGYFIDKKWSRADKNLWIKKINVIKR